MDNITREFEDVKLDGALVTNLEILPLKKVGMRFFTFPTNLNQTDGGKDYDIQFNKVAGFTLKIDGFCPRVSGHKVFLESDYLDEVRRTAGKSSARIVSERLHHFRIEFDIGQLDVVAENFLCMLLWET